LLKELFLQTIANSNRTVLADTTDLAESLLAKSIVPKRENGSCRGNRCAGVSLGDELVFDWFEDDGLVELGAHKMTESRLRRLSLAVRDLALGLGVLLQLLVDLDPVKELLTTARVLHVLHAKVDALRQNAFLDALVDNDTECVLCHVVHDTSASVVALVRHAFLHCTVATDIYDVPLLVRLHVGRQGNDAIRLEFAREQVTRPAPVPLGVDHFYVLSSAPIQVF